MSGCLNSHWLIVMPTMRLEAADKEYAIVGVVPVDASGITYIYDRQSYDTTFVGGGAVNRVLYEPKSLSSNLWRP